MRLRRTDEDTQRQIHRHRDGDMKTERDIVVRIPDRCSVTDAHCCSVS